MWAVKEKKNYTIHDLYILLIAFYGNDKNTSITCSSALVGSVGEKLLGMCVVILDVFEANISVVFVALLMNVVVDVFEGNISVVSVALLVNVVVDVFGANISVVSVALLVNVVVTSDINVVDISVGRICVDFDSVTLVDKTAKKIRLV